MGPQRKQEKLAEACNASPTVLDAYTNVLQTLQTFGDARVPSSMALHAKETARAALKTALQGHGFNRFDARALSEFAGTQNAIAR